ncbi:Cytochrome c oxidase assembly factor 3 [Caenorhabditis elegans]|uniref:Cytochrome c oxidase assembly factor 3 n=1 Tax=Caenorhabditis elegans TaxID=6239 RepID=Q20033_CAEEL|nr:Cytochrome c oxidase assembly factor 3 [Caenorhabditis elegans]CCD70533.1 Cytochrome c oxidase assembly factor 3 [Caenorhabditis elegans]|eukprot:NP_494810.2 Cytochrome Oxidase Assembly subunits [Caenorhabditis elegans]
MLAVLNCRTLAFRRLVSTSRLAATKEKLPTETTKFSQIEKKKDNEMLETIDIEDLPRPQKRFAKQFEKVNQERVKEIFAKNYKNHISFAVLLGVVIGIYWYTMYSVKQETFLEEIDEEMAATNPKTHGHLAKK